MKALFPSNIRALLAAALLPVVVSSAAESPSVLLQKGIYAEEIELNLDSAIKIYEQIAAEAATNRAVVAQAQYRLAVCYQKKGEKEQAIRLLAELVREYPTDSALSLPARERLVALGHTPSETASIRRIASLPPGWILAVSPDGRLVEFQLLDGHGNSGDLCVYDVSTGKTRVVARSEKGHVYDAAFSPDGENLAYTINGLQVWVAKIGEAVTPRKLLEVKAPDARRNYARPGLVWTIGWTPGGTKVVIGKVEEGLAILLAVDVATGHAAELVRLPNATRAGGWGLSWNGKYVTRRTKKGAEPSKISVVDLKTAVEQTLVENDNAFLVGWAPADARVVWCFEPATPDGSEDIWAIPVAGGKASGKPELVMGNVGAINDAFATRDGNIYYSESKRDGTGKMIGNELWVMEGFLTRKVPQKHVDTQAIREITGPNNSILDQKVGLAATLPLGWTIKGASRHSNGGRHIAIIAPEAPDATTALNYSPDVPNTFLNEVGPKPTGDGVDAWLRRYVEFGAKRRLGSYPDYTNRSDSIVFRMIDGKRAVSWTADFTHGKEKWLEYLTYIYSDKRSAQFSIQGPVSQVEAARPAMDRLAETLRMP